MRGNNKGFTLVELLAVIALLAILTAIAVPNVLSTINNNKRNTFLLDAKRMVSKAEYLLSLDKSSRDSVISGGTKNYYYTDLNVKGEFNTDSDGGKYEETTYIKVSYNAGTKTYTYCAYIIGSKRQIVNESACLTSDKLTGISVVTDK